MPIIFSFKCHLSILILILFLALYVPSSTASSYIARENPDNVTAISGVVDCREAAILDSLYQSLNKVAVDINQSNFDQAEVDYYSFKDLYNNNKAVIQRMYDSDAARQNAINATDLAVADINDYLNCAGDYNKTYSVYAKDLSSGDNASAATVDLNAEYRRLNSSYDDLQTSVLQSLRQLESADRQHVNASFVNPLLAAASLYTCQSAGQYESVRIPDEKSLLTISVLPHEAAYGDLVSVTGKLVSETGSPASGCHIDVYMNDTRVGGTVTDDGGAYVLRFPVTDRMSGGMGSVRAIYDQDNGSIFLSTASLDDTLDIMPKKTFITLNVAGTRYTAGDAIAINGTLVTENGIPVTGAEVAACMDSRSIGNGTTDANGSYAIKATVPYDSVAGNYSLFVTYTPVGSSLQGSSSEQYAVQVNAIPAIINVNGTPLILFLNDRLLISGSLRSNDGLPARGQALEVRVAGGIGGMVMTDENGNFNYFHTVSAYDPAGMYSIAVVMPSMPGPVKQVSAFPDNMVILPVSKTVAMAAFAALIVLVFALILLIRKRQAFRWPIDMALGCNRIETGPQDGNLAVQVTAIPSSASWTSIFEKYLDNMSALIAAGDLERASVAMYVAARAIAIENSVSVPGSKTHREFYSNTIVSYPSMCAPLLRIVNTYERMRFGPGGLGADEMYHALDDLKIVYETLYGIKEAAEA